MVSPESLIHQCVEGEDEGWEGLCEVIDHIASVPIRQLLRTSSETLEDADDLRQEFFLYLRRHSARRIQSFRGTSEGQLRCYLRVLVVRFVRARLARNRRQRSLEEHAWIARGSSMPGPTLSVLQARIGELETILSRADRVRWRLLQAESPAGDGLLAERTRRRWVQDLACRYAERLI